MQKRILRELTKTFPENVRENQLDYSLAVCETIGDKKNHINNITLESKRYNCTICLHLKDDYPFKPPTISLNTNSNTSYSYWCSRILKNQTNYNIFISYVFSCINMKVLTGIEKNILDNKTCLCCQSLTCGNRWNPSVHIFMIFNECIFNNNIKKYLRPIYRVYFEKIFRNDKWNLSDDVLLHIIGFL